MVNKVILLGNLTRDVELKYTQSGLAIGKIGLATNRRWKDSNTGEEKEEVMFIDVNLFGKTAEVANQYLSKGRRVYIEGRLVLESWTDQSGNKRSKHSVIAEELKFIDSNSDKSNKQDNSKEPDSHYEAGNGKQIPVHTGDVPF